MLTGVMLELERSAKGGGEAQLSTAREAVRHALEEVRLDVPLPGGGE